VAIAARVISKSPAGFASGAFLWAAAYRSILILSMTVGRVE